MNLYFCIKIDNTLCVISFAFCLTVIILLLCVEALKPKTVGSLIVFGRLIEVLGLTSLFKLFFIN